MLAALVVGTGLAALRRALFMTLHFGEEPSGVNLEPAIIDGVLVGREEHRPGPFVREPTFARIHTRPRTEGLLVIHPKDMVIAEAVQLQGVIAGVAILPLLFDNDSRRGVLLVEL